MQQELDNADIHSGRHDVLTMHVYKTNFDMCGSEPVRQIACFSERISTYYDIY